jgi:hypothetical protein
MLVTSRAEGWWVCPRAPTTPQPGRGCDVDARCPQVLPPLVITVPAVQPADTRPAHRDQREQQPQPHISSPRIPLAQPRPGLPAAAEQAATVASSRTSKIGSAIPS